MNDIETTFTITGAAVAVFAGLATVYYFKKPDEEPPHIKDLNETEKRLKLWLDDNYPVGTGKHKRSRKHKRSKKHKK